MGSKQDGLENCKILLGYKEAQQSIFPIPRVLSHDGEARMVLGY